MAELTIDPATIRKALDEFVESYKPSDTPTQEVGYVATAGDGIAHVTGSMVSSAMITPYVVFLTVRRYRVCCRSCVHTDLAAQLLKLGHHRVVGDLVPHLNAHSTQNRRVDDGVDVDGTAKSG